MNDSYYGLAYNNHSMLDNAQVKYTAGVRKALGISLYDDDKAALKAGGSARTGTMGSLASAKWKPDEEHIKVMQRR